MSEPVENPDNPSYEPVRRISGHDALFVHCETPKMPMHTLGVVIMDPSEVEGDFGYAEAIETVAGRIHTLPPFRQRLLEIPLWLGHPFLADDPDFRVENHMHRVAVPAPGGLRELSELVADFAAGPLERSKPLWEMWFVEGLEGGRVALVMKMHHCLIDGASGSSQMANLMDLAPDAAPPAPPKEKWDPAPLPSALERAQKSLFAQVPNPFSLGRLVYDTTQAVVQRRRALNEVADEEGEEPQSFFGAGPVTFLNKALTPRRCVAFGSASLEDIKFIKNAYGVTVNDAVLAACSLAVRRYLERHGDLPDEPLVCLVPVSTKSEKEKQEFSNKVSNMNVMLPTHVEDFDEMIEAVVNESKKAKFLFSAVEPEVGPGIVQVMPPVLLEVVANLYSNLDMASSNESSIANLVISNMMGPPMPLYFGGARVEAVYPLGPVAEAMGLNITVLSNNGNLDVGILGCRDLAPDLWDLADGFGDAVAELKRAAEKLNAPQE